MGGTSSVGPRRYNADGSAYTVRLVLGLFNGFCILSFRNGVAGAFGRGAANWYVLLQASQFHIMYYASRTLSNFFAFGLCRFLLKCPKFDIKHLKTDNEQACLPCGTSYLHILQ